MIAQVKIVCKGFTLPDYRNEETEKDVDRQELLINSNIVSVRSERYNLNDDEYLAWLKIVRNLIDGAILKEEHMKKEKKS